jgi:hypothetical protein
VGGIDGAQGERVGVGSGMYLTRVGAGRRRAHGGTVRKRGSVDIEILERAILSAGRNSWKDHATLEEVMLGFVRLSSPNFFQSRTREPTGLAVAVAIVGR